MENVKALKVTTTKRKDLRPLAVRAKVVRPKRVKKERRVSPLDAIVKVLMLIMIACFIGVAIYVQLGGGLDKIGSASNNTAPATASATSGSGTARTGGGAPANGGASRGGVAAITVTAKTLQAETLRQRVALNGNVSSRTEVGIYPNTGGKVTSLSKQVGDTVRRGEVIAMVDPSRPGTAYAMSPVTATVSGTIIELPVNPGETVTTGTSVATIGSLDNLIVTIYVAEKYSAYLTTGLTAFVTLAADPDTEHSARVTQVKPVVNSKNRTIETTLTMDKAVPGMRPGMFAEVSLIIREEPNTLVVPKAAITAYNDSQVVYVAEASGRETLARRVPVTLGLTNDTEYQVISGLSFGDKVITAGAVTDGSNVRIAGE
jgi:multidrug efflux pump subunit AcrA (membrane-fusion protein)